MREPFPVGKPVRGGDFVGRSGEVAEILKIVDAGQSVVLSAPRRFGKTSIIIAVLSELKKRRVLTGVVDIFDILSREDLAERIVETTLENERFPVRKLLAKLKQNIASAIRSVELKQVIDRYEFILGFGDPETDENALLSDALDFPEAYAKRAGKPMVFVYDEFGDLLKLDGAPLLKKMRARFQYQQNVTYIFSGSQESLMSRLFSGSGGAFFKFGRVFEVGPISEQAFGRHIERRFGKVGLSIERPVIDNILSKTQGHPYYTQLLCQLVYLESKGEKETVTPSDIELCYGRMLLLENSYFDQLWSELMERKNHLIVVAEIAAGGNPYALSSLTRQNVHRVLSSLIDSGHVRRINKGSYQLINPLFRDYVRRKRGEPV